MIIRRYLLREILYTLLVLTALLILIYVSHQFIAYLVQAAAGSLPAEFILRLLLIKLLTVLMLILPLAFFLAILLALGRLYKDNEITALAACGIPIPFMSILIFASIIALGVSVFSLFLSPWAQTEKKILQERASITAQVAGIAAGRFKEFTAGKGRGTFYVESMNPDNGVMQKLFVQVNLPEKQMTLTAQQGYQVVREGELFIVLVNGHRYENTPDNLNYIITAFAEHMVKVPLKLADMQIDHRAAIPTGLLWGRHETTYQAELQWRLSFPLSVILLAALAVPLSHTTPRQGQYAKIFFGILIYLIYNNLLNIAQKWVERGTLSPWIGVWWVHACVAIVALFLFYWQVFQRGRSRQ